MLTNTAFRVDVVGHSRAKFANEFKTGDVVRFEERDGKTFVVKNGRKIKHPFNKTNLRFFGKSHQLSLNVVKKSNVVDKAIVWGGKVFGVYAPGKEDTDKIVNEMTRTGWTAFKVVAKLAAINKQNA